MQIPKGDSFGNRTAQLRQTAIQGPSGDGGRGMVQGVDKLYTDLGASANLDAENALFDYQKKLDAANAQVVDLFAAGEITDQDMALQHQKVVSDIPTPDFSHLSLNSEKRFLLEADKLRYSNKLKMAEGISQAQKERAKVSNQNCLANVTDQAYNGNISASEAIQALDSNDAFQKNGEFAFGLDWESQKQANYQKLQSYYILGGINDANNTGNTDQLKNIRTMLLEDNNEVNYLTPFARNKYIKQANSFIDMNVGQSYSNTLTTGVDQLVERTGDFSAVKAYSWLSSNQEEEGNRLETAQYIAGRLGLLFNQQQYNDNPNYVEQLKQSYFLDSLDQYGSPIVAGLAIKFGDKQINEWLEKIGDPSKGQLLESEFINNIPDKKAKQVALQISQQTDAKESNQSDIDLILANIDHNKDLNDTQKRIAKASVKQFMKEKQEAIQANYIETHKNIWSRLYVQGEPINQIDAKQWSSLNEADRKQILEPPPTQLNFPIYQEARGRIMAGTPVNLIKNYYDKIPSEQLKELIDLQETIKNDPARRDGVIKTSSMINSRIDAEGRLSDKNRYTLNASIADEVEAFERKQGRVATPKEILYIVDKQFVLMKLDDGVFFDTKKPYYQMTKEEFQRAKVNSVSDIPPKELRKVKDALKIKKLSITDENILDVYTRRLKND